ncbi:MAG TPA: hypothetical protein VHA79_01505 [Mycobacteriales bacterium]|jgi:hypothetical protein|nr:hypothetical protein [Mycobacteriales bacterium]
MAVPVPSPAPTDGAFVPSSWVCTSEGCAVTSWQPQPREALDVVTLGLALVVFLLAALLVGSWGRA